MPGSDPKLLAQALAARLAPSTPDAPVARKIENLADFVGQYQSDFAPSTNPREITHGYGPLPAGPPAHAAPLDPYYLGDSPRPDPRLSTPLPRYQ
jgi:hypothetical protein